MWVLRPYQEILVSLESSAGGQKKEKERARDAAFRKPLENKFRSDSGEYENCRYGPNGSESGRSSGEHRGEQHHEEPDNKQPMLTGVHSLS